MYVAPIYNTQASYSRVNLQNHLAHIHNFSNKLTVSRKYINLLNMHVFVILLIQDVHIKTHQFDHKVC